jgi:hypothetical protein
MQRCGKGQWISVRDRSGRTSPQMQRYLSDRRVADGAEPSVAARHAAALLGVGARVHCPPRAGSSSLETSPVTAPKGEPQGGRQGLSADCRGVYRSTSLPDETRLATLSSPPRAGIRTVRLSSPSRPITCHKRGSERFRVRVEAEDESSPVAATHGVRAATSPSAADKDVTAVTVREAAAAAGEAGPRLYKALAACKLAPQPISHSESVGASLHGHTGSVGSDSPVGPHSPASLVGAMA